MNIQTTIKEVVTLAAAALLASAAAAAGPGGVPDTYTDWDGGYSLWDYAPVHSPGERADAILAQVAMLSAADAREIEMARRYVEAYCGCTLGDEAMISALDRAVREQCRGACFAETARCMQQGADQGFSGGRVQQIVAESTDSVKDWCEALHIPLNEADFGTRLRIEFQKRLAAARGAGASS